MIILTDFLKNIFRVKYLRYTFLLTIGIAVVIPTYEAIFIFPKYRNLSISMIENEASRTAKYLAANSLPQNFDFKSKTSLVEYTDKLYTNIKNFNIVKLKLFSNSGEIIWSTDTHEVGTINKQAYFHNLVSKGFPFTKLVQKKEKTLEGEISRVDVIETYVPFMQGNEFTGAFEIYYDVTTNMSILNDLSWRTWLSIMIMGVGLVCVVMISLAISYRDYQRRLKVQEELQESEEKYRILIDNSIEAICVAQDGLIKFFNHQTEELCGYSREELTSKLFTDFIHDDDQDLVRERHQRRLSGDELPSRYSFRIVHKNGNIKWVELNVATISWDGRPAALCFLIDITESKHLEDERKILITDLQEALENIQTLKGLIPICASCKKIRDDKGYWNQMEKYISDHSDAKFSHGICPDCAKKLYPELYKEIYDK